MESTTNEALIAAFAEADHHSQCDNKVNRIARLKARKAMQQRHNEEKVKDLRERADIRKKRADFRMDEWQGLLQQQEAEEMWEEEVESRQMFWMADLQHDQVLITVARAKEARECVRRSLVPRAVAADLRCWDPVKILDQAKKYIDDPSVVSQACLQLTIILSASQNKYKAFTDPCDVARQHGVISYLMGSLHRHLSRVTVQEQAIRLLQHLCSSSSDCAHDLLRAGAFQTLIKVLEEGGREAPKSIENPLLKSLRRLTLRTLTVLYTQGILSLRSSPASSSSSSPERRNKGLKGGAEGEARRERGSVLTEGDEKGEEGARRGKACINSSSLILEAVLRPSPAEEVDALREILRCLHSEHRRPDLHEACCQAISALIAHRAEHVSLLFHQLDLASSIWWLLGFYQDYDVRVSRSEGSAVVREIYRLLGVAAVASTAATGTITTNTATTSSSNEQAKEDGTEKGGAATPPADQDNKIPLSPSTSSTLSSRLPRPVPLPLLQPLPIMQALVRLMARPLASNNSDDDGSNDSNLAASSSSVHTSNGSSDSSKLAASPAEASNDSNSNLPTSSSSSSSSAASYHIHDPLVALSYAQMWEALLRHQGEKVVKHYFDKDRGTEKGLLPVVVHSWLHAMRRHIRIHLLHYRLSSCLVLALETLPRLQKAALIVMVLEEGEEGNGGLRLLQDVINECAADGVILDGLLCFLLTYCEDFKFRSAVNRDDEVSFRECIKWALTLHPEHERIQRLGQQFVGQFLTVSVNSNSITTATASSKE